MFLYNIYGKNVLMNVELPLLLKSNDTHTYDLKVYVDFEEVDGEEISIKETNGCFEIFIGSLAYYFIDPRNDEIYCKAKNLESFFSTFFNIPYSVYCLCNNEILYHASSLLYKDKLLCLTGEKGVGKSTLTAVLNMNRDFHTFGDDTIYIHDNLVANRAHNLVKQTTETVDALDITTLNIKNAAGKHYSSFEIVNGLATIGKIFHISRSNELKFEIKPILNELKKNSVFKSNIVGVDYMPYSLISKVLKVKTNEEIQFYDLVIPNDLNFLIRNKDDLIEKILYVINEQVHDLEGSSSGIGCDCRCS